MVPNAGWSPTYDVHADKVNNMATIVFKATIFQNSGIKWDNIKLTLSTGNPTQSAQEPVIDPQYLTFYSPRSTALDEVVVVGYGTKRKLDISEEGDSLEARIAGIPITTNATGVNTTYAIDLNYTIPSDGQKHLIAVKDYKVNADYRYVTIPKLDEDAFLEARITNWEDLNLLPAQTNVFYDGSFVGNGYLDTKNTTDTLNISFGRDKKIIIKREKNKDFSAVKFFGSNVHKQIAYDISIRNTRAEAIDIIIKDQFPIATDKDIEISDNTAKDAIVNTDSGIAEWTLHLAPNETKKLTISYSVKYPKDKTITGLY